MWRTLPETRRRRGVGGGVAVLCVAQFVVVLDVTIVAIALPAISRDLGFQPGELSWVITAYTVVLAGLLILGGRAADLVGAARMFRVGLVAFSIASLACALAWSPAALICARIAQGVGAALLSPAALASLNELIERPGARRRALGWWTAAAAGGGERLGSGRRDHRNRRLAVDLRRQRPDRLRRGADQPSGPFTDKSSTFDHSGVAFLRSDRRVVGDLRCRPWRARTIRNRGRTSAIRRAG